MSLGSFMESWTSSSYSSNRYKLRTAKKTAGEKTTAEDLRLKLDASTITSKLDFFRSMGLEFTNCCDINCNNNNNYNNINNNYEDYDFNKKSSLSERMIENFDEVPEESFSWEPRLKNRSTKNSETYDMVGYHKLIPYMKECSVTIVGEKCKVCGRSFKCIRDVQIHEKKKHRKRKPRKKLVLKIGDEVISRLPIKRRHLKWHHKEKHRTIDSSSDDVTSLYNGEGQISSDQLSDEEMAPFIDTNFNSDRDAVSSPYSDMDNNIIELENAEDPTRFKLTKNCGAEEEEIQVLLRITRPRKSVEINHETPNRIEREQLISDAIREFVRLDSEIIEIDGPARNIQAYQDQGEIIEEYCRLATGRLPIGNLDSEEHNCSFHIENEEDIDCSIPGVKSFLPKRNDYFNEEIASTHSHHYRDKNGDIIPDFIDYTRCLDDRITHNPNSNNVDDPDTLFYNETQINEWNKALSARKPSGFDDILQNTSRSLDSSVLIKEEIMLDDIL